MGDAVWVSMRDGEGNASVGRVWGVRGGEREIARLVC